tara:strand:+ start:37159 stop:37827 length:669 start_codon:yes stop_codon:yes gene_type:complete
VKALKSLLLTFGFFITAQAQAGFITTNETELDAIFSQISFASKPIDIRIGTATELVLPNLVDITTDAEVNELFSMHVGLVNVVNFYFIDTISACGGFLITGIVGCGETPGNNFVVESSYAAGSSGGELLAHELAHNLGLNHQSGNYLMNESLNGHTTLTTLEVDRIHSSSLVQTNGQEYWININPVLIVASASTPLPVPEPSTLMLFLLSFGFIFKNGIKRK